MKIDWNTSEELLAKAKKVYEFHTKDKLTYPQIASVMGYHRTYVIALKKWYMQQKGVTK